MSLEWAEHLSVGNSMIDSDHKQLISLAAVAEEMLEKRNSTAMSQALDRVENALQEHFANEENIAAAIKFPFVPNKLEHECVLEAFYIMKAVVVDQNGEWDEDVDTYYSDFLSEWLIGHIIKEDMLMKPVLQTYPYDFRPY